MKAKLLNQIAIKGTISPDGTPSKQVFTVFDYDGEIVLRIDRVFFAKGIKGIEDHYVRTWKGYGVFYSTYSIKVKTLEQAINQLFNFNIKEEQK